MKDKQDAVVRGAQVKLTNQEEGTVRTAVSGAAGEYGFIDVKAGEYTVEVTVDGFQKYVASNVALAATAATAAGCGAGGWERAAGGAGFGGHDLGDRDGVGVDQCGVQPGGCGEPASEYDGRAREGPVR